jgi:hypothetical protein
MQGDFRMSSLPRKVLYEDANGTERIGLLVHVLDDHAALPYIVVSRQGWPVAVKEVIERQDVDKVTVTWKSTGADAHVFKSFEDAAVWYATRDSNGVFGLPLCADIRDINIDCDIEELAIAAGELTDSK